MTQRYRAITPNRTYKGKTYGVQFDGGKAIFDDLTVNEDLGLSAKEIAIKMIKELGYSVTTLEGEPVLVEKAPEPVAPEPVAPKPIAPVPEVETVAETVAAVMNPVMEAVAPKPNTPRPVAQKAAPQPTR